MSSTYLYGVTERRPRLPDGLHALEVGPLVGVHGPNAAVDPTPEALWAHEAVVEQLLDAGPVLPARFGTVLSEDELRDELERRAEEFSSALELVRDRVELGVRASWLDRVFDRRSEESGSAYLDRKLRERQAAEDAAADLHEPLAHLAVRSVVQVEPSPCLTLVGSYLVEREEVERFRAEAERLGAELDGVVLVCTGPWPPYSFAAGEGAE